jgi:hypothetical protein
VGVVTDLLRKAGIDLTPVPSPPDPRDQLRQCRLSTAAARQRHETELEVVRRLQSLGPIADELEREAQQAEAAAGATVTEWARGQADTVGNGELFGRAEIARSRATRARIAATGATKQLTARDWDNTGLPNGPYTTPEELAARNALRQAEDAEQQARAPIIEAQIEPALSEFCELMSRVRELDQELQAFEAWARYAGNAAKFKGFMDRYCAARQFVPSLRTAEEKASARIPWGRFDNALKVNPDAQFEA